MYLGAGEPVLDRLRNAAPPYGNDDLGSGLPAKSFHSLIVLPALGRLSIDFDDLITSLDAGSFRRCFRERSDHGDPAVPNVDLNAQTRVIARGLFGQCLVIVAREQHGVWIHELLQHAPRCLLIQIGLADRIDEVGVDVTEHVIEQASLLIDVAVAGNSSLEQPSSAEKGHQRNQHNQTPTLLHFRLHWRRIADAGIRQ